MNWLIHPIDSLKSWGIKKYVLGIVNGAIARNNEHVTRARWYVTLYITKAEALLKFLRSLDKKLEDGVIDENEAAAVCDEAKELAKELVADAARGNFETRKNTMKTLIAIAAVAIAALTGCAYKGGKIVEGTDIAVGLTVPGTDGVVQLDALNYLTGFRFAFAEDSGIKCRYTSTNSVSAFGVYESSTVKAMEIELNPTVDEAERTAADGEERP